MSTLRHGALPGDAAPRPPLGVVGTPVARRGRSLGRRAVKTGLWAALLGNVAIIVWLWVHGGNVTRVHTTGELLTSVARLTGLLGAYSALLQVVLLARLPVARAARRFRPADGLAPLERPRLPRLVLAHVVLHRLGLRAHRPDLVAERDLDDARGGVYPGMITATVGTALLDRRGRQRRS